VIAQGIVPRLLQLVGDNMMPMQIKVEATVTLGSLAKGTEDHVKALVDLSIVPVLINGECDVAHWQIKVYSLFCLLQAFPLQQLLVKGQLKEFINSSVVGCVQPCVQSEHSASAALLDCWAIKMRSPCFFRLFGPAHPVTQHHMPSNIAVSISNVTWLVVSVDWL